MGLWDWMKRKDTAEIPKEEKNMKMLEFLQESNNIQNQIKAAQSTINKLEEILINLKEKVLWN
mgnify:CR=1 FL=1